MITASPTDQSLCLAAKWHIGGGGGGIRTPARPLGV